MGILSDIRRSQVIQKQYLAMQRREFAEALVAIPSGYSEGVYAGRRYGVTLRRSDDGKRSSLYAQELGGRDVVSFNLYRLNSGEVGLKPCEMSSEKVESFVLGLKSSKRTRDAGSIRVGAAIDDGHQPTGLHVK